MKKLPTATQDERGCGEFRVWTTNPLGFTGASRSRRPRSGGLRLCLKLLLDFRLALLVPLGGCRQLQGLFPDRDGLRLLAERHVGIREVIEDFNVLAFLVLARLEQVLLGFL